VVFVGRRGLNLTRSDLARRELFAPPHIRGLCLIAMNFLVRPNGPRGSVVSTATRVFATDPEARRTFATYWRVIYPGSAIIRRSWLRAIRQRAELQGG
jgi:hypothetical protein